MIRFRKVISSIAFASLALFIVPGNSQAQSQRPWNVISVSGDVRHSVNSGPAAALKAGGQIDVGSKVTTGPKARVVLARGTESMTMSPRSEIAIPAKTGTMLTRIMQNLGTLLLKVEMVGPR